MNQRSIGIAVIIIAALAACYENNNNPKPYITRTDSNSLTDPPPINIRSDNTYVDLTTGIQVKVRVDSISRDIIDETTNQPVMFFIDPSTSDTFDRKGRRVNNALIRGNDNSWTVDESKLKLK